MEYGRNYDSFDHFKESHPGILWHYTTSSSLINIFKSRTLWASDSRFLNDSSEISYALDFLNSLLSHEKILELWNFKDPNNNKDFGMWDAQRKSLPGHEVLRAALYKSLINRKVYLASFCKNGELLSQWRAYGGSQPVAIRFDKNDLTKIAKKHGGILRECIYNTGDQGKYMRAATRADLQKFFDVTYKNHVNNKSNLRNSYIDFSNSIFEKINEIMRTFKHPDFQEEQEVRLIFDINESNEMLISGDVTGLGVAPHLHIRIPRPRKKNGCDLQSAVKGIIVGPGPAQTSTAEALWYELPKLWSELPIFRSETPYSNR